MKLEVRYLSLNAGSHYNGSSGRMAGFSSVLLIYMCDNYLLHDVNIFPNILVV
jgi:hypothetical protein